MGAAEMKITVVGAVLVVGIVLVAAIVIFTLTAQQHATTKQNDGQ
jgi:hypothetical protein